MLTRCTGLSRAIEQSNIRRAAQLSLSEKFRLGADLYDDRIRWLKQIIKPEQPQLNDEQVNRELDRRRAIKRRMEETGVFQFYEQDASSGEI